MTESCLGHTEGRFEALQPFAALGNDSAAKGHYVIDSRKEPPGRTWYLASVGAEIHSETGCCFVASSSWAGTKQSFRHKQAMVHQVVSERSLDEADYKANAE